MIARRHLAGGLALAVLLSLPASAAAAPAPLLGSARLGHPSELPAARVLAVRAVARRDAPLTAIRVYAGGGRVRAALYASRKGAPARRLTQGSVRARARPAWRTVAVPSRPLVRGRTYWIAVVSSGRLRSRAPAARGCRALAARSRHGRLPARWPVRVAARCSVAVAGIGAVTAGGDEAAPGAGGAPAGGAAPPAPDVALPPGRSLAAPAPAVVDLARTAPLMRYGRDWPGGAMVNEGWGGGAAMVLAAAAYAGDTRADARLLEQMRETISGGEEPVANGGYPAQHERWVEGMYAVGRHIPRIWNQLSATERAKVDLVMTGALVGSAFTVSDANPYLLAGTQQYTLDGDSDVNRDWNPNMREGMVGMLPVAAAYFGDGNAAQYVLDHFDHASFLAQLRAAGLTNMAATFAWRADHPSSPAPTAAQVEAAVHGFRYYGLGAADTMPIFTRLSEDTYERTVSCGLDDGAGIPAEGGQAGLIVSGCESLPNKGATGMLKEFDVVDANGPRSSAHYSYDGYRGNLTNHYVLLASGLWRDGPLADRILSRMRIGVPDLWYKLDHGYRGYAKGSVQWIPDAPAPDVLRSDNANFGFPYARSMWTDVVAPAHGLPGV